jgi:hypothetical protein
MRAIFERITLITLIEGKFCGEAVEQSFGKPSALCHRFVDCSSRTVRIIDAEQRGEEALVELHYLAPAHIVSQGMSVIELIFRKLLHTEALDEREERHPDENGPNVNDGNCEIGRAHV